ncbi:hypothetical protein [Pseudoclavibacter terrae]|uniref:hypothetical protein n=1 Tax=Pseudoclavibacter terrae TaxID=1530195 RepID=UPI00232B9989|nr:hypothetical protein [Pseudoclavibacter terrae]
MRAIDDLRAAVRSRAVREQFDEAARAYSAGAYRTATIALWIAVVQDLLGKLRELASDGDGAANALVSDVDAARSQHDFKKLLTIEAGILDRALTDFELLDVVEHRQLVRLHEDRNRCAHPSFQADEEAQYAMTEEQVRAYMVLVVDSVLSQPPIVGKAMIARYTDDTRGSSWPDRDSAEYVRGRYFTRARAQTQRQILQIAVKAAITPPDGDNTAAGRNVATLRAALSFDEKETLDVLADVLHKQRDTMDDSKLRRLIGAVGWIPRTWDVVGTDITMKCRTLLESADLTLLLEDRAFASGAPAHPELATTYAAALERLSVDQLRDLSGRYLFERRQFVPLLLHQLDRAESWRTAGGLMAALVQVSDLLTLGDIQELARIFVGNSEVHHSFDTPPTLVQIVQQTATVDGAHAEWTKMYDHYQAKYAASTGSTGGTGMYSDLAATLNT